MGQQNHASCDDDRHQSQKHKSKDFMGVIDGVRGEHGHGNEHESRAEKEAGDGRQCEAK